MAIITPSEHDPMMSTKKQHKNNTNRPPKQKQPTNPLQKGIKDFLTYLPSSKLAHHGPSSEELVSSLPKRYTIYEPMLLLPPNVFTHPPVWGSLYESLDSDQRQALYASIAGAFTRYGVTHIAMNAPIILTDSRGDENRMRSPVGLVPLHGDFGPPALKDGEDAQPSEDDYEKAFWVQTIQNHGIVQIWAPLYTMFSRGNVTEKARILGHASTFEGLDGVSLCGEGAGNVAVVDMYAGIGYFVFSYLRRGVKRVWGWEINGWSVEGLRRGCVANGWGCMVVRVRSDGALSVSMPELVEGLRDEDRVVIFHGDNGFAAGVMGEVRAAMERQRAWTSIRHVNLGLLPSSSAAWSDACRIVDEDKGGWIHVHENVDIQQIEEKGGEITGAMRKFWTETASSASRGPRAECRHVEQVKTYAPGIMHCVFDLKLYHHSDSSNTT